MADKKHIEIEIGTSLKKTGIDAAVSAIKHLGARTKAMSSTVGKNLMNIYAGFQMLGKGVSFFMSALEKGMAFERLGVQFKSLTGSLETAKAHLRDLQDLGRTPPFSLELFAQASQEMMKMTGGMVGFKDELQIVGDIAAATGSDIASVGRAFGLAYQTIRDGKDFGRAGAQLVQLGVLTKAQVEEFSALSKAGEDNKAVWDKLTEVFGRYKGAMEDTEKTTKGLVEAIQGEATVAITDMSSAINEAAKPALEGLLGWMKQINEDGTIELWAEKAVSALGKVGDAIKWLEGPMSGIWKGIKATFDAAGSEIGRFAGALSMGEFKDAFGGIGLETARAFTDAFDLDGAQAAKDSQKMHQTSKAKLKRRAEEAARLEAEAKAKKEADLAAAQEKLNAEKAKKLAETEAAERVKAEQAAAKEREKLEAKAHAQRMADIKAEQTALANAATGKQGVAAAAQSEFDRAFGWFRDEEAAKAGIGEEIAYSKDLKRLNKEANRYGGKWRIDELSRLMSAGDTAGVQSTLEDWRKSKGFTPQIEAMVRASAAQQTKTTAEDELRKIEANTAALSDKLDSLLALK